MSAGAHDSQWAPGTVTDLGQRQLLSKVPVGRVMPMKPEAGTGVEGWPLERAKT